MPSPKKQCRTCGISINAFSAGWCRACWLQYHKDLREAIKSDEMAGAISRKEQDGFRIGDRIFLSREFIENAEIQCDTTLVGFVADIRLLWDEEWIIVYIEAEGEYWPMCAERMRKIDPLSSNDKLRIIKMAENFKG